MGERVGEIVDAVYRSDSRRMLATLIRLLGDFDRAEEAMHDAFAAAVEQWPQEGVPANPRAWLVSAGRFKAIDGMRRRARFDASLAELAQQLDGKTIEPAEWEERKRRRRSAAVDLYLLSSRSAAGCPDCTDTARSVRPDHRGDRPRISHRRAYDCQAHRARQSQDPRRAHPLRSAVAEPIFRNGWTPCSR